MMVQNFKDRLGLGARRFRCDQRGSTVMIFAVFLMAGVGFAAIAIDGGYLFSLKNKLQTTADAAVLVAVTELPDTDAARTAAIVMAGKNMAPGEHGAVLANADVVTGNWDTGTRTFTAGGTPINGVRVITRRSQANGNAAGLFFASILGFDQADVVASATATFLEELPLCILAFGTDTLFPALEVSGSAIINALDCHFHSNQPGSESISVSGSAAINTASTCAVGDIVGPENITPAPQTGCDPMPDPMAGLPEPSFTGCDFTNFSVGGTQTITPGVYCGGIALLSNADITLAPGLYYIQTGSFRVPGNAALTGDGVIIYFDPDDDSYMDMVGGSTVHLSAPTSGTYAGIVIFASRSQSTSTRHTLSGNAALFIDGAVYLPHSEMYYRGNSGGSITVAIADRINLDGHSSFQRNTETTNVPLPSGFPGAGGKARLVK